MIRFEAPIMLTGLAALSVETQKYLRAPFFSGLSHGLVGIEDVDIDHAHEGVGVFFTAHVLERREVEHIVVALSIGHKGIEDIAACIDGKGRKFSLRYIPGRSGYPARARPCCFR